MERAYPVVITATEERCALAVAYPVARELAGTFLAIALASAEALADDELYDAILDRPVLEWNWRASEDWFIHPAL